MEAANGGWVTRRGRPPAARPAGASALAVVVRTCGVVLLGMLAGCGAAPKQAHAIHGAPPGVAASRRAAPAAPPVRGAANAPRGSALPPPRHPHRLTWQVNPDTPLPRRSPWSPVLAVARRFAVAYMSYEVAEVGSAVREAIAGTCTSALAAELLVHPALLPPGVSAQQVRQRLVGIVALARLRWSAMVIVNVASARGGGGPGALELRLVPRPRGWRVAAMTVV